MGSRISTAVRAALLAGVLFVLGTSVAPAADDDRGIGASRFQTSDSVAGAANAPPPTPLHHGPLFGHLPPKQENLEVVGSLEPTGAFGPILEGQIADVAVHKGYAYLNSWDSPVCQRGGTYIVDIRNPSAPREAGFIPAPFPYYHGEGAHVVSINTPAFQGDLLAVNDETYGSNVVDNGCAPVDNSGGGFDLYDVTNPEAPVTLVQGAGDRDPDNNPATPDRAFANSYHSVFVWQDGPRAFLVASDNIEFTDVDIFDITDPRAPVFVGDHDLVELFPEILDGEQSNGGQVFHHDMVVKNIGGRPVLKSDYWDAGYVQMDVSDPANPVLLSDTTFAAEDPLFPGSGLAPEGNGHQGEFSFDNQFLIGADEDFATFRLTSEITSGPNAGHVLNPALSAAEPIADGTEVAGDTEFVGFGCPGPLPAPSPGVTIALAERGGAGCPGGFQEKIDNIEAAGYEMAVIFNNDFGAPGRCETLINMLVDPNTVDIPAAFVGRADAFRILDVFDENTYQCTGAATPTPGDTQSPAVTPAPGSEVRFASDFDGWGYAHLFDAATGEELDAFAIPEAVDSRFATDFGDLSIHEVATDPTENLAYSAYYAGGMRVFAFDRATGLNQVGAYVGPEGNNFWGVEQFTTPQGERLIAGSDRDFGLYIFRYTGAGAAQRPVCTNTTVMVPFQGSADVPLGCSDANGNPLRQSRTSNPAGGTIADKQPAGGWTYTHTGGSLGPAGSFTFTANDGAADSNTATASLVAVARDGGRCFNPFVGSAANDAIVGSPFGDRIGGAGGADNVGGRGGDDCLDGNGGGDRLAGEGGADTVSGDDGRDRLFAGDGSDRVTGDAGNDSASGGGGNDRMAGNAGNDSVSGGDGRDRLNGNGGRDRLNGGDGRDRLNGGGGKNRLSGGGGNDQIRARNGAVDRINCGAGRDSVRADRRDRVADNCERVRRGGGGN